MRFTLPKRVVCAGLLRVSGLVGVLVILTSIETAIFDIRPRVARRRPSADEAGGRYCIGFPWDSGTAEWTFARISDTTRGHDGHRDTSACGLMDAHRGSSYGGLRAVACLHASRRSVELHHAGNPRCRPGTAWTWRLVGRCSPLWMEAHRPSRPKELSRITPFELVLTYF